MTERPPYERTAVRPTWDSLPEEVRARVASLAGEEVVSGSAAGGGFTRGFAGLVQLAGGGEVFVKAASREVRPVAHRSYLAEARVLGALPPGVPAPGLRWWSEVGAWVVLGIEPVHGRMPGLPWNADDVDRAVAACEAAAAALTPAPRGLELSRLSEDLGGDAPWRGFFDDVGAGRVRSGLLDPWAHRHLPELHRLVQVAPSAVDGETACHGDLRADNLIVDDGGVVWVCDWNWLALGAAWSDVVGLLVTAHADGIDVETVLSRSWLLDGVESEAVDAWLALLGAFMVGQAERPAPDFASTWLNAHRAHFGSAALAWLERRRSS